MSAHPASSASRYECRNCDIPLQIQNYCLGETGITIRFVCPDCWHTFENFYKYVGYSEYSRLIKLWSFGGRP